MREAIVTLKALEKGKSTADILTYHWFVVESNEKELVLAENIGSKEQVVIDKKCVLKISYLD